MATVDDITVNVSPGELLDRMCIMQIKFRKVRRKDDERVRALALNLQTYLRAWAKLVEDVEGVDELMVLMCCEEWLFEVHARLWNLEDAVRAKKLDDSDLLQRYEKITEYNDVRARIKKKVDSAIQTFSPHAEIKSHEFSGEIDPDVFLGAVSPKSEDGICITI